MRYSGVNTPSPASKIHIYMLNMPLQYKIACADSSNGKYYRKKTKKSDRTCQTVRAARWRGAAFLRGTIIIIVISVFFQSNAHTSRQEDEADKDDDDGAIFIVIILFCYFIVHSRVLDVCISYAAYTRIIIILRIFVNLRPPVIGFRL